MFVTKTFPPLQIKCFHKDTIHLYLENLSCHERSQYFIGKTRCQKSHLQDSEVLEEVFCPFLLADRLHPWQKRVTSLYGKAWFKGSITCLNKIIPVSKSLISLQGGDIPVLSLLGCFTFNASVAGPQLWAPLSCEGFCCKGGELARISGTNACG